MDDSEMTEKMYQVTIRAKVTKTLTIIAASEDEAVEIAHTEFTTECDGDEDYEEDMLSVDEVAAS